MNRRVLFAVAMAVVAAITFVFVDDRLWPRAPDAAHDATSERQSHATPAAGAGAVEHTRDPARVPAEPPPTEPDPWLDHRHTFTLRAQVVTLTGLPAVHARPRLAPPTSTLGEAMDPVDAHGRLTLSWPSRVASGQILVEGYRRVLRCLPMQDGAPTQVTLTAEAQRTHHRSDVLHGMQVGLHAHARFVRKAELMDGLEHLYWRGGGRRVDGSRTIEWTGTVRDPANAPAPGVTVALIVDELVQVHTATDERGRFALPMRPRDGTVTVRATHPSLGAASLVLPAQLPARDFELVLDRGITVRGLATDARGEPVADSAVTWTADDGTAWSCVRTDTRGAFTFANVRGGRGTVHLWPGEADHVLPTAFVEHVAAGEQFVALRGEPLGALHLLVEAPAGLATELLLRLRHERLALAIERTFAAGTPLAVDDQPPGTCHAAVFHRAAGWLDLGHFELLRGRRVDLGTVRLPEPGRIEVAFAGVAYDPEDTSPHIDPTDPVECYAILPELDLRVRLGTICAPFEGRLPAGDYAFLFPPLAQGGVPGHLRFSITPGQTTRLDLGPWLPR